ncbi:MAG: hypothetical protein L0271_11070 [Gemmatimonadetes bacterium]|nr:hypothetical protein [Gemmatimonadota bacterium]
MTDIIPRRCMFCDKPFPDAESFEGFACGHRIAWDPLRFRLWAICDSCNRWNLRPWPGRLAAIDALERIARDEGRLMAQTANIALLYTDAFTLLRVGRAKSMEEAWWRYGRELIRRRRDYEKRESRISAFSYAAIASISEAIGLTDRGIRIEWDGDPLADVLRWRHFPWAAWHGREPCPSCNSVLLAVRFDLSWWLHPRTGEDGRIAVGVPCDRCDPWTPDKVYRIEGDDAETLLRRVLAYQQIDGANDNALDDAADAIRSAGSAEQFILQSARRRGSLWRLGPMRRLALEIAMNRAAEARVLGGELRELESRWAEEEEIARIVDEELSFLPPR